MSMLHRTNLHGVNTPPHDNLNTTNRCLINITKMLTKYQIGLVSLLFINIALTVLNGQFCIQLSTLFMSMSAIVYGIGSRVMGDKIRPPTSGTPVQNNSL